MLIFFVANLATFIIPAQPDANDLPIVVPVEDENMFFDEYGFPVTNFPPKSEYALSLIDPDPEPPMSFDDLPSQFSWLDYDGDWTTSAKDQGNCGSCWAFGALGGLEAAINIKKGDPNFDRDLSEQYILACLSAAGSCNGGWMSEAIACIKSENSGSSGNGINGVPLESCMPYQGVDYIPCDNKCDDWDTYNVPPEEDDVLWQVQDFGVTTISEDDPNGWDLLKTWCITYGPVIVDIYTGGWSSYWSSHHNPTDVYQNDDSGTTNHAQLLCGWVDDSSILNGGYWILKNSWGPGWGYNGFSNIAYGCNSLGTRDDTWVTAIDWPYQPGEDGPGPIDYDLAVFANYNYQTYDGNTYPHPGDQIKFTDNSEGDVALREWDFDGDGVIDSNQKNPTHIYTQEGKYEVTLTVTNEWGLSSNRTRVIEVKEIWPPVAVLPDEYTSKALSYSFDGRYSYDPDQGTITSYHWDFDDGTTDDGVYTTHTFPAPDKIYDVKLTVTDNDGAKGSKICQIKIDQTIPPVTTIIHGIGADTSEWYRETQRISLSATDWTSVSSTYYRIDGGSWIKYTLGQEEKIPISTEGEHTVEAYSVDYWGNQETPVSETFAIDKTNPALSVKITGGTQNNGWYNSPVTVELSADDAMSGLYKIMYRLDYTAWVDYTNPITIGEGKHYLCAFAVDNAGNANTECTNQINVDLGNPETICKFIGQGTDNRFYKQVEIRVLGTDDGAGVKNTYYKLDNGALQTYYQPIIIDTLGDHTIEYYSVDNIDNQEPAKTASFKISNLNFDMAITSPINGLYLFGIRLLPLQKTILIGTGEIYVTIESFTQEPANIDHVEFLLDGVLEETVTSWPYSWTIEGKITGVHTIEVVAYTSDYDTVSDEITATLLIF